LDGERNQEPSDGNREDRIVNFKKTIRKAVVLSKNSLYYRIYGKRIEILSFYLNKKNPKKKI
jgi:hypothetical protein